MTSRTRVGVAALALLLAAPFLAQTPAAAAVDGRLQAAVNRVVANIDREPVSKWNKAKKAELAACIGQKLAKLPEAKKQRIIAAKSAKELRARFDEVTSENRFALERAIRRDCVRM